MQLYLDNSIYSIKHFRKEAEDYLRATYTNETRNEVIDDKDSIANLGIVVMTASRTGPGYLARNLASLHQALQYSNGENPGKLFIKTIKYTVAVL